MNRSRPASPVVGPCVHSERDTTRVSPTGLPACQARVRDTHAGPSSRHTRISSHMARRPRRTPRGRDRVGHGPTAGLGALVCRIRRSHERVLAAPDGVARLARGRDSPAAATAADERRGVIYGRVGWNSRTVQYGGTGGGFPRPVRRRASTWGTPRSSGCRTAPRSPRRSSAPAANFPPAPTLPACPLSAFPSSRSSEWKFGPGWRRRSAARTRGLSRQGRRYALARPSRHD